MTYHEELGISLIAYSSIAEGVERVASLDKNISDYGHTISANGGFDTMNVTIADDRISLDEWIERGIGRHIVVYNSANLPCWEGFVNIVSAQMGSQRITIGPLIDIGNCVSVAYSPIDTDTTPPTIGTKTVTTIAENEKSQSIYGIIEKVLSAGRVTDEDAEYIRDTYLQERAYPETSSTISIGGSGGEATLTLECLGYWYFTNAYVFNDTTAATLQIHDRIEDILDENPNTGMFGAYHIDINNSIVPQYSDEDKAAMAHLKELLAIGGANDQRYTLGFYEDRKAYYKELPDTPAYKTTLTDQGQRILTYEGSLVYPWDLRPAQWLFISDSLIGRYTNISNYYEDPRYMFIEQVQYNAPWGLTLSGTRIGTYEQLLAKMGLGSF